MMNRDALVFKSGRSSVRQRTQSIIYIRPRCILAERGRKLGTGRHNVLCSACSLKPEGAAQHCFDMQGCGAVPVQARRLCTSVEAWSCRRQPAGRRHQLVEGSLVSEGASARQAPRTPNILKHRRRNGMLTPELQESNASMRQPIRSLGNLSPLRPCGGQGLTDSIRDRPVSCQSPWPASRAP